MKRIRFGLILAAAALMIFGLGSAALAFHEGGVAHCDGCHTMHNSEDGESIIDGGVVGTAGAHLTIGADPGSTCLSCHEGSGSYHIFSSDGSNMTPGGDFYWLTKTFTYTTFRPQTRNGYSFGHNVIAADFGLVQDPVLSAAPGGSFPSNQLTCSSCHDPHGKKVNKTMQIEESGSYRDNFDTFDPAALGNFRLLGDVGYEPGAGVTFIAGPPVATTPHYRRQAQDETDSNHTDYGSGMSEWCANCHSGFLSQSVADHRHPASDAAGLTSDIVENYNEYVKTGDLSGTQATAYFALVPFETGATDPINTDPGRVSGPTSGNVACISCHRAHVSAFPNSGRWDFETELLVDSHPQDTDGGAQAGDQLASYYGRDIAAVYGPGQRSLCNKCHQQD
jgi:hypothetical protein